MRSKLFFLLIIGVSLLFSPIKAQTNETECISKELDGSLTLRVWGIGRNK